MNDNDIKGAFERMGPSPEAEDRMLAAILAENDTLARSQMPGNAMGAHARTSDAPQDDTVTESPVRPENLRLSNVFEARTRTVSPHRQPASHRGAPKKRPAWRRVLPLVACLVLLAGIGAFAGTLYSGSLDSKLGASQNAAQTDSFSQESAGEKPVSSPSDGRTAAPGHAATHPLVALEDGTMLRLAFVGETQTGETEPLLADAALVGEEIGSATAHGDDGVDPMECTVFAYSDEQTPYAVRYGDDAVLYRAALDTAQGEGESEK